MTKGEKTKQTIVEKSISLFSENGYAGTSIRKIASESGLRESAIYNYFKSKEDLLEQILREFDKSSTGIELLTEELIDKLDNPPLFMKTFCEQLITKWTDKNQVCFLKLILREQNHVIGGTKLSITRFINEARNIWRMIFEQMVKYKFTKEIDPVLTANEFVAPLFFIRLEFLLDSDANNKEAAIKRVDEHINYFWESIKP